MRSPSTRLAPLNTVLDLNIAHQARIDIVPAAETIVVFDLCGPALRNSEDPDGVRGIAAAHPDKSRLTDCMALTCTDPLESDRGGHLDNLCVLNPFGSTASCA